MIGFQSPLVIARFFEHVAQVVVGFGIVRPQRDRPPQRRNAGRLLTLLVQQQSVEVQGIDLAGDGLQDLAIDLARLLQPPRLMQVDRQGDRFRVRDLHVFPFEKRVTAHSIV